MQCPGCKTDNPDTQKFCGECGKNLQRNCPRCSAKTPTTHKFCGECGHNLDLPPQEAARNPAFDEKLAKIRRYLPEGLTERILSQRDKIEGERRQVTILFCDMAGYTGLAERLGPEEAYSIMDQVYEILIHKVHDYEGTVSEMTGDGIMAIFGAPVALEDAPQRAIKASYAIHRGMTKFNEQLKAGRDLPPMEMRIGIHAGPVVVGTLGNNLRVEFKAVGDTVNLASRVENLAEPGTTYVTQDVYRLAEGFFRFESLGEKKIKGRRAPVNVYRVISPSTRRTRFDVSAERGLTPFVARTREIDIMLDLYQRAKHGRGQAFSLMGEAGTGKSRLLYEFRKAVSNENITFLEGKCLSYTRGVAYMPIVDLLKANFYIHEQDGEEAIRTKVSKGIHELGADEDLTAPYILELLSPTAGAGDQLTLNPETKKQRIVEALRRIVLKGSEIRPLIMAFEDLHWMDKSSEDSLKDLLENISGNRVLLIFTFRPDFVPRWGGRSCHSQINLDRFSDRASFRMLSLLLGTSQVEADLEKMILEKTEGIPFFIEEFVRSLQDRKLIVKRNNHFCLAGHAEDVAVPATIHDVIMSKVDSLPEGARSVLQTGAVAGREFNANLIQALTDFPEQDLLAHFSLLKDAELLYERGIYPQSQYLFKHALTQEVIYGSLLKKRREETHERIAGTIEALNAHRLDEFLEVLAYHYSNTGNRGKAISFSELAGDKAARVHSLEEARQHYESALSVLGDGTPETGLRQKQIELAVKWAEVSQYRPSNKVAQALQTALRHAQELDSAVWQGRAAYWINRFAYMLGDISIARPGAEQCIQIASDAGDRELLGISCNLAGRSCLYTDEYKKGIEYLKQGLQLLRPYERWDEVVYSEAVMGLLLGLTGNLEGSTTAILDAISIAKDNQIRTFEAMAYGYLGSIRFFYGDWEEAIADCSTCLTMSARLGNVLPQSWASLFKGASLFFLGEQGKGLGLMRHSIDNLLRTDSVLALRFLYSLYAELLAEHGDFSQAETMNQMAFDLERAGQKWGEIINFRTTAVLEAAKRRPNWSRVEHVIDGTLTLAKQKNALPELLTCHRLFSGLLKRKGDTDRANLHMEQGRLLAMEIGFRMDSWNAR